MKKILLSIMLFFSLTIVVSAKTIDTDGRIYSFDKVDSSCVSTYVSKAFPIALIDGKILYTDTFAENFVFLTKDGTCDPNVSIRDAINGREELKNIPHIDVTEKDGKSYAVRKSYSIWTHPFIEEATNETIELTHYDQETLDRESGIEYYIRVNNSEVVRKVPIEELSEDNILLYYYDKDGEYKIEQEIITEVNTDMIEYMYSHGGLLIKSPRENRVFVVGENEGDDKKSVLNDDTQGAAVFTDVDNFEFIESNLFYIVRDGVGIISDGVNEYHTMDGVGYAFVEAVDNESVLITINYEDDTEEIYLLNRYEVDDDHFGGYYRDGDFTIKFVNNLEDLNGLYIDSTKVDSTMYNVDSTKKEISIKKEYLDTLAKGDYEIKIVFKDDIELSAELNIYDDITLTFDANGGVYADNKTSMQCSIFAGYECWTNNLPTREGYKFKGYFSAKTGGDKFEKLLNDDGIDEEMTLYAQWELDEEVPKTLDNITSSMIMGTISLIGLVGATIYFRKRNKVRA